MSPLWLSYLYLRAPPPWGNVLGNRVQAYEVPVLSPATRHCWQCEVDGGKGRKPWEVVGAFVALSSPNCSNCQTSATSLSLPHVIGIIHNMCSALRKKCLHSSSSPALTATVFSRPTASSGRVKGRGDLWKGKRGQPGSLALLFCLAVMASRQLQSRLCAPTLHPVTGLGLSRDQPLWLSSQYLLAPLGSGSVSSKLILPLFWDSQCATDSILIPYPPPRLASTRPLVNVSVSRSLRHQTGLCIDQRILGWTIAVQIIVT